MAILWKLCHVSPQVFKYHAGKEYLIPVLSGMFTLDNENGVKIAYFTGYFFSLICILPWKSASSQIQGRK